MNKRKKKGWEPVPISPFHKYWSCWFELHQRNRKASKTLAELESIWLPLCIPSLVCVCRDEKEHGFQCSCSANRSGYFVQSLLGCRGRAQCLTPGSGSPSHCITDQGSCLHALRDIIWVTGCATCTGRTCKCPAIENELVGEQRQG